MEFYDNSDMKPSISIGEKVKLVDSPYAPVCHITAIHEDGIHVQIDNDTRNWYHICQLWRMR